MTVFESVKAELDATQQAADQLLQTVASDGLNANSMVRLEKLATACARLAFPNGLSLTTNVHNLIAWCDHLDEESWKAGFADALRVYPLISPWDAPNPSFLRTASLVTTASTKPS
jgi:hypothetical protein